MSDTFNLEEALAGLPPEKVKQVKDKWEDLNRGYTQASQKASEYDRLRPEWEAREGQYRQALTSFDEFFRQMNEQNNAPGTVRNPGTGRFESRREANAVALPAGYDPEEVGGALRTLIASELGSFKEEILGTLNKEKTEFGTQVYTNTGQMLQWERQLQAIRSADPEADPNIITKVAREKGLRDLNDAYYLAYGKRSLERSVQAAAEKAAKEAAKETETRLRAEFAKTQIEGASGLAGVTRRKVEGAEPVAKTRQEAEARATEALTQRWFAPPEA